MGLFHNADTQAHILSIKTEHQGVGPNMTFISCPGDLDIHYILRRVSQEISKPFL